ncbi:MAG: ASKHA domain-containing protein [Anaerolineales bacterium]|nr:ASKHA domain-containing protein [Anaerolineales bacterium]
MPEAEKVTLVMLPSGRRGQVTKGSHLLEAARQLGVELESICAGRQTCGKCQVIVESGNFPKHGLTSAEDHLTPIEPAEQACCREQGIEGRRLACAARIQGDLLISVPEESQARKQIVAKAATQRVIEVQPAVRQVYVEVDPPGLDDGRSDWSRLRHALQQQWGLGEVEIEAAVLPELQPALRQGRQALTVSLWHDRVVLRVQPGYVETACGLAIDVGSTTVVVHLCDLRTGAVLATQSAMNPQVRYGEDLMSRVSYAMTEPQGVERMHRAILRTLNELAAKAAAEAGVQVSDVLDVVIVGNPVMHHLLLGIDPVELGAAPFTLAVSEALDLRAGEFGLHLNAAARLHVLPCIAGHVGADHVAALLAEAPQAHDEIALLIDVGTNAELSLGGRQRMACASSPTGPAFEGAQITHGQRAAPGAIERVRIDRQTLEPRWRLIGSETWIDPQTAAGLPGATRATGICGSGIIEVIAEMFLAGILGADGRFSEQAAARSARVRLQPGSRMREYVLVDAQHSASGRPIVVTQNDVRAIQLAKGALYAGARLLMKELRVDKVDRILLAGAFGSYIDPLRAMVLGMIPDCDLDRVHAVGNAAGDGARIALLNVEQRLEASRLAGWVEHVQTATASDFQEEFVAAMALPHARDEFPHLLGQLPDPSLTAGERPRTRRKQTRQEESRQA